MSAFTLAFSTPGTVTTTLPRRARHVRVRVWGGGGRGAAAGPSEAFVSIAGGGGGSGAYGDAVLDVGPRQAVTVTVGGPGQASAVVVGGVTLTANGGGDAPDAPTSYGAAEGGVGGIATCVVVPTNVVPTVRGQALLVSGSEGRPGLIGGGQGASGPVGGGGGGWGGQSDPIYATPTLPGQDGAVPGGGGGGAGSGVYPLEVAASVERGALPRNVGDGGPTQALTVEVQDERTFYDPDAPLVANAWLVVRDADNRVVAVGKTGRDGTFTFALGAGDYVIYGTAPRHVPGDVPVTIPGDTPVFLFLPIYGGDYLYSTDAGTGANGLVIIDGH
jgi:hypothetical protein